MSHEKPGLVRRFGMRVFRRLPPAPSYRLMRLWTPTFSAGAIALIEYDGAVLALRQTHRTGLSLPGGLIDRGEVHEVTVVREVLEETWLHIESGDVYATVFEPRLRHIDVIFRVVCEHRPQVRVASEATGYEWLPLDQWQDIDSATARILRAIVAASGDRAPGRLIDRAG